MNMEEMILLYLKPELVVLVPVLYFIGLALKNLGTFKDKYIPLLLGVFSVILVFCYLLTTVGWSGQLVWMSIIQGVLAAAGSVYCNQIIKQLGKKE